MWKLVARMGKSNELRQLKEIAIRTIKNASSGYASRFGAQIFLCKCDEIGLGEYEKWLIYEKKALVQAFVAPYLRLDSESGKAAGKAILSRSSVDGYLGLVKPIIDANLTPVYFGRNPEHFPLVAQFTYKAAGLTGHTIPKPDAIGNLLAKRYAIQKWNKWQDLFLGEYGHAHMILQLADTYFDTHFTSWLNYQDTFNEILFKVFQEFLAKKGAPGAINLTRNGERIKFGVLLNNTPNFKAAYPNLQDDLYKIHRRRNHLPSSHAYDEKTGDKAKPLKKKEQSTLKKYVDDTLKEIITIVEGLGI